MSTTQSLIIFNQSSFVDQTASSVSHHRTAHRQKVENDYKFTDASLILKMQLLQSNYQSSLDTFPELLVYH